MSGRAKSWLTLLTLLVGLVGIDQHGLPSRAAGNAHAADITDPAKVYATEAANVYTARTLAEAKLAMAHADPRQLAKEMRAAALQSYAARMQDFLAGRGTLDLTLSATRRVEEAELAVLGKDADVAAVVEWRWEQAWEIDRDNETRYQAGRIAIPELLQSRYERLDAEIAILRARAEQAKNRSRLVAPDNFQGLMFSIWMHPLLGSNQIAKAKFAVSRADVPELARARLEAARGMLEARMKDFEEGRGTQDILLKASVQALQSELDIAGREPDPVAAYQRHWALVQGIEAVDKDRFDRSRIAIQEYAQARSYRLQAEMWLLRAKANGRRQDSSALAANASSSSLVVHPLSSKELAKAKAEADQANLRELQQARFESARLEYENRDQDFLVGRGTLDMLFSSSQRLLEAELALSADQADRLAARERYWERALMIERINESRFNAGRISIKDYMDPKYFRFKAEIQLIQAKANKEE